MNHQSRDISIIKKIDAYVKDQLSEEEIDELWVELLKNPEYLEYLETEIAVKSIYQDRANQAQGNAQPGSENGDEPRVSETQHNWKWIAAAASVAVLVVAINFLRLEQPTTLKGETIGSINLMDNMAAPLVVRSQKSDLTGADSLMNVGFEAALSGDVKKALEMYRNVVENYENEAVAGQAYLNIGIIRYNNGEYEMAGQAFEQALSIVENDDLLREKAYWYLGNAYINMDQLQKARQAIHSAYSYDGTYRKPAFRLLRKLDYELGNIDFEDFDQQIEGN